MSPPALMEWAAKISAEALPLEPIELGPWEGSMRSITPDLVPISYLTSGSNMLYRPRYGTFRRRDGQTQKFDTFGSSAGLFPAKWGAKGRWMEELLNSTLTSDGVPTIMSLATKETIVSGLDDGRFSQLWARDQVANSNYTYGSEFGPTTYQDPGTEQAYKVVPLWYDSGDGGVTRGATEFARRFFFGGSRRFLKVGRWHYFPSVLGTPSRALIERAVGTAATGTGVTTRQANSDVTPSGTQWALAGSAPAATTWQSILTDDAGVTFIQAQDDAGRIFICGLDSAVPDTAATYTIRYRARRTGAAPNAAANYLFAIYTNSKHRADTGQILSSTLTSSFATYTATVTFTGAEGASVATSNCVELQAGSPVATGFYVEITYLAIDVGTPIVAGTVTSSNRLIPSGPLPPTHAGTITPGTVVPSVSGETVTLRPSADEGTDGGWTDQAAGTSLFAAIDETTASDADYIQCAGGGAACIILISDPATTPVATDTVTVRFRAAFTVIAETLTVQLYQGATLKATKIVTTTGSFVSYAYVLTAAEQAAISDWTDLRFKFTATGSGAGKALVSYAAISIDSSAAARGGWLGHDKFYRSVAYRFEDGSVWALCTPRAPNSIMTSGYNLTTLDENNPTTAYASILWQNIPVGPYGVVSRLLLRTNKIDSQTDDTAQLDPFDLLVVWEIKDNITTQYEDFFADDDSLTADVDQAFIRFDHIMPPRARYIFGGDMRVCHSYIGLNPCAIELAPVGFTADYDRNSYDTNAALYGSGSQYYYIDLTPGTEYLILTKRQTDGSVTNATFPFATYDTLQKLVDVINISTATDAGGQWRAQLCPGVNPDATCINALTPHRRAVTGVTTSGSPAMTVAAGGLSLFAVGNHIMNSAGTVFPEGTRIIRVDSDTQITASVNAGATGTTGFIVSAHAGDDLGTTGHPHQRAIGNCLPGFLYFNKRTLNADPIHKQDIFMTVASPGSTKSAANNFSGKQANRFSPPDANAGNSMGGGGVDQGFVVPFANAIGVITNTRDTGSGVDEEYRLEILNHTRGCNAWNTVVPGKLFVPYMTPHGMCAANLQREILLSPAVYVHPSSDAAAGVGDFSYELPLCSAATAADTDGAYASCRVMRDALWVNYRASGSHPNRQVAYDFSSGIEQAGLAALVRDDGTTPWGWSMPLVRSVTAMCVGRRGDGEHLYAWNDENAGSTGDGRVDEIETSDTDNGTAISGTATGPWLKGAVAHQISGQEVYLEHQSPTGSTGALDFIRSYSADTYTLTPSANSSPDVVRDVIMLPQAARVGSAACRLSYRQLTGAARELRKMTLFVKRLRTYT